MKLPANGMGIRSANRAALALLVGLLFGSLGTKLEADTVYASGYKDTAELPTELYRFNDDGSMDTRWDAPDSRFGLSLANVGLSLYVAEFGGAIHHYDLAGNFLGEFADVSALAGPSPNLQVLETDLSGYIYTTFSGQSSLPRTSFRLNPNGTVSQSFSHPDLVFPRGIDAAVNGDVYIVNSAAVGVGQRLFRFDSAGSYIDDYAIPEVINASGLAIDEAAGEAFIGDEFGDAICVYDISTGAPAFSLIIPTPGATTSVFIEQASGRILGTYLDSSLPGFPHIGFEVLRDGTVVNLYIEDAPVADQTVYSIVALADSDGDGLPDVSDPSEVAAIISSIPLGSFGSASDPAGQRNAFLSRLEEIEAQINAGDIDGALRALQNLLRRTDGCDGSGGEMPDSNDWITDCAAQHDVQEAIADLIAGLTI